MRPCVSRSNWNLEVLAFKEMEKPEYSDKNLSEQRSESATTPTDIWHRRQDSNPGHTGRSNAPPLLPQRASRTPRAFKKIQKNAKYSPRRKRKDSKRRSINFDCINVVFAFVALNIKVPTFLNGLLMLDKQDLRTRVGGRIFKT